jgi:hypothetical protein
MNAQVNSIDPGFPTPQDASDTASLMPRLFYAGVVSNILVPS